jgi:hypothetical protein
MMYRCIATVYLWELHVARKDTVWTKCGDFIVKHGCTVFNHPAPKILRLNNIQKLFIVPTEYTCGLRITQAKKKKKRHVFLAQRTYSQGRRVCKYTLKLSFVLETLCFSGGVN